MTNWTEDFSSQNAAFSEEEIARLTTAPAGQERVTVQELAEDAETFFRLLKTTYGAYDYFGGDAVFLPLRSAVLSDLADAPIPTSLVLEKALRARLGPVVRDGHFSIGSGALREEHVQYMYYVPDLYLPFAEGTALGGAYIKPTVGPDGALACCFAAMSHDGSDLPPVVAGKSLHWVRAGMVQTPGKLAFAEQEAGGIPTLVSRRMYANSYYPHQAEELERFAACGGEYAAAPLLIFDLRANVGGSDEYIMKWFGGWAGQSAQPRRSGGHRYSQLACRAMPDYYPADRMGTWRVFSSPGVWARHKGVTFVLTDKGTASSGETAVEFFRTAENTVFVGGPTLGCALVPNNLVFYLPHSGISLYFGTGLLFCETAENRDGTGYFPDLWVNPPDAVEAVLRLVAHYELQ